MQGTSPLSNPAHLLFCACDNSFWSRHCTRINIHVIPDCRWKMWRRYPGPKGGECLTDGGNWREFSLLVSHTRTSFESCADTEMFIPCCSCKNYGKDRDSKIRLQHYVADVVLKGGKTHPLVPHAFRRGLFMELFIYLWVGEWMFIHSRSYGIKLTVSFIAGLEKHRCAQPLIMRTF